MSRFGIFASRNKLAANGNIANATTNTLTPLYVKIPPINTIARIVRFTPTTFPKIAPSKNTGKYNLIKPTIFSIKIFEKKGNT